MTVLRWEDSGGGEVVAASDYDALKAEAERLAAALERISRQSYRQRQQRDPAAIAREALARWATIVARARGVPRRSGAGGRK